MNKNIYAIFTCLISIIIGGLFVDSTFDRTFIEPSAQRSGNAKKGYDYLVNGNYVNSGMPYEMVSMLIPKDSSNYLGRSGEASLIPPTFNLIKHTNGTELLSPNCLTCHSDKINGEFILGLGNTSFDYTTNTHSLVTMLSTLIKNRFTENSPQYESFIQFENATNALNGKITTKVRGVNPADKLTSVLIAHRDPVTLEWMDQPQLEILEETIPTDVPAWWLLKKKNAMFSTAIGRGDFSRFLMASSLLTFKDSTEAAEIDRHFPDVLTWINSLQPPKYPEAIDQSLALEGQKIFELNCSSCHGTYGSEGEYPNLIISLDEIGTDPYLSKAYSEGTYSQFIEWYKKSWFSKGQNAGDVKVESGYIAPPLDGVWATAPYLHNASIPNIELLLNSKLRPKYWKRSFDSYDYDMQKLGWKYTTMESKEDNLTYDTTIPAYHNTGHTFGDDLSNEERLAVIEYLKTL